MWSNYEDDDYGYEEPCLEDYEEKPWIWPGYGAVRPAFVRHRGVYKSRRILSDLQLAMYLDINHLNLSDAELRDIGYYVDQYDTQLLALFDERTALMATLRPGSNPPSLVQMNAKIWERLRLFVAEREGWKRAMLYGISLASGMDDDHPVYGGADTALCTQLQEALLHPDRVDSVGLQMTIQMIDPAIEAEVNDAKEFAIFKMFATAPERPKKFVPDPEIW